eukprot:symbB.v1.2.030610.t1/scaffold3404.1/size57568/4
MDVDGAVGPCLLEYQLVEGNGKWMAWNASWFLSMFERFVFGERCGNEIPCLQDSQGRPLEFQIMRLLTINAVGHHFVTLLRICPLIPFFGTIYAALVFQEAYMVVQALSLISMAQRAAKVPAASSEQNDWGVLWMNVLDKYWPRVVHVGLGDVGEMLGRVFASCDLERAAEIKFYHVWTHSDPMRPVLDQICGSQLALMQYNRRSFEAWIEQFKMHVEARPRILLVDRSIGAHPIDQDIPSRVATGYGVDSVLLDLLWAPKSSCQFWSREHGPCCVQTPSRAARFPTMESCEEFCCKSSCWGCMNNGTSWNALFSCRKAKATFFNCTVSQKHSSPWGHWLEFGVYYGATLRSTAIHLARQGSPSHQVYGFDSFQGLVEDWTNMFPEFGFSTEGEVPADLPPNAKLVIGWYNETLPLFVKEQIVKPKLVIEWLHLDCDTFLGHHQEAIFGAWFCAYF